MKSARASGRRAQENKGNKSMKNIFSLIICFFCTSFLYSQNLRLPEIGEDLVVIEKQFTDQNYKELSVGKGNMWKGSEIYLSDIGFNSKSNGIGYRLIRCNRKTIGILFNGKKKTALLDIDGYGTLGLETNDLFIPFWVFDDEKVLHDKEGIKNILDILRNAFQNDTEIGNNNVDWIKYSDSLRSFINNEDIRNRDLLYRIWFYSSYIDKFPSVAYESMNSLANEYKKMFGQIHPMILEFLCESEISLGGFENAIDHCTLLQEIDPDFIPGKITLYRLSLDQEKEEMKKKLVNEFPNHWMVKNID
jgi:hypothetical protein